MVDRYSELIEEIVEDLDLQAGVKLTEQQLLTLRRTQQISFAKDELRPDSVAVIESYIRNTAPAERVWDCYWSLSDSSFIIAIRLEKEYVRIMLM
ncbi:hypothetical protein [uncultured Lacticaseibacillus sp.]|uniref:hypothetical protein n=1 Tax=uncultured Lacticaseibacillus sp. TaxID=2775882 RepID=UPI00259AA59C|nr:hypothetical protein [uncultured Lacticaseibacillus sp.]